MTQSENPSPKPVPDAEVLAVARRRSFTAKYKLRILRELDAATEPGQSGEVLRREGLYSSHVTDWRRKREAGELQGLATKPLGRPKGQKNQADARVAGLERELARAREDLRKARIIIAVQKKVAEMLGILSTDSDGKDS